ncbi:MAG: hypothetical protein H6841_03805 [Planctomycetes bacterium]|nr:hypothetical protein [Planctomycetota bacterium]MCB9934500.1 hypothetical protein [Planctomycetota bacterium]
MSAIGWVRNGLIFAGMGIGGALAIAGAIASKEEPEQPGETAVASSPITLNTAKPPDLGKTPLAKPLSLESAFGRSELTGLPVAHVPLNPLEELDFDRRWDITLALKSPKPPVDLPPQPAPDEVAEPEHDDASLRADVKLDDLPNEAKQRANDALVSLRDGSKLLKEGMNQFRRPGEEGVQGSRKIREAADLLRDARDKLESALKLAPQHPELLRLMQEAKANLYICLKHGM